MYAAVALGTLVIEHGGRFLHLSAYTHVSLAALFLVVAIRGARQHPGGLTHHGLRLGGLLEPSSQARPGLSGAVVDLLLGLKQASPDALRATRHALTVATLTFPPFVAAYYVYQAPTHPFVLHPIPGLLDYLLSQLLVVALPEEALFRGYFQTQLSDRFPETRRILGVPLSLKALLLQAALFALLHFLVTPHPARLAVFFPALVFGWIRAAQGGIGSALVYHALCNLLGDVLARGFL